MPAESERLRRRMRGRDRWFLGLVAGAALAGIVAALVLSRHDGASQDAGCVVYSHPNFTGGATYRYCGREAAAFCRRTVVTQAQLASQCERLGLTLRARPRR